MRTQGIESIRKKLVGGQPTVGSMMQLADAEAAEIMGKAGYDWVVVDLGRGLVSPSELPNICRALELGSVVPLARIAQGSSKDCQQALSAGVGGLIVPAVRSSSYLKKIISWSTWPPIGLRPVVHCRANLYGKEMEDYRQEAENPLIIAQIEHVDALDNFPEILSVEGLDAIWIDPFAISVSLDRMGEFFDSSFLEALKEIESACIEYSIPLGMHIAIPDQEELQCLIDQGYQFLGYASDTVFLRSASECPKFWSGSTRLRRSPNSD